MERRRGGARPHPLWVVRREWQPFRIDDTVVDAFRQLCAEGYLEGKVGVGTCVARTLPDDLLLPSLPATYTTMPMRE